VLVSVIIPVYDGELYLREALASVLAQTHRDLDVVVIDDGSRDGSAAVALSTGDHRVRVLQQPNAGVAAARNAGIAAARGGVLAFLDADDVWASHKLATQLPRLTEGVGAVGALMVYLGSSGPLPAAAGEVADDQQERIAAGLLMPFPPSSLLMPTALVRELGGFDEKLSLSVAPVDDLDLLARVAQRQRVVTVPRTLGWYRIHESAASFGRFHDMSRATRFVVARLAARRAGGDLEWDDWEDPAPPGWQHRRSERAHWLYRRAGLRVASGQRLAGAATAAAAAALSPGYVVPRLLRQRRAASHQAGAA